MYSKEAIMLNNLFHHLQAAKVAQTLKLHYVCVDLLYIGCNTL